jgi:hypothetical protein
MLREYLVSSGAPWECHHKALKVFIMWLLSPTSSYATVHLLGRVYYENQKIPSLPASEVTFSLNAYIKMG